MAQNLGSRFARVNRQSVGTELFQTEVVPNVILSIVHTQNSNMTWDRVKEERAGHNTRLIN